MEKIIKIIEKYLEIKLEKYVEEGFYKEKESGEIFHITNYLWQLKSKKLYAWEKSLINSYRNKNKVISFSVKRGSISSKTRKLVNERDEKICQYCQSFANPEIAHIVSRGAGGSGSDITNLITLCRKHHQILDNPIGFAQNECSKEIKEFIKQWRKSE